MGAALSPLFPDFELPFFSCLTINVFVLPRIRSPSIVNGSPPHCSCPQCTLFSTAPPVFESPASDSRLRYPQRSPGDNDNSSLVALEILVLFFLFNKVFPLPLPPNSSFWTLVHKAFFLSQRYYVFSTLFIIPPTPTGH